jgi:hypothetical protein
MQQRPNDPDAAVAVAHQLINEQDWSQASQLTERAAGLDPFHTENRIHRAFLKAVQGNNQQALSELEHLFETYPDAYEALLSTAPWRFRREIPAERWRASSVTQSRPLQTSSLRCFNRASRCCESSWGSKPGLRLRPAPAEAADRVRPWRR